MLKPSEVDTDMTVGVMPFPKAACKHGASVWLTPHRCSAVIKFTIKSTLSSFNVTSRVWKTTCAELVRGCASYVCLFGVPIWPPFG